jgi:hypothetical protein
MTDAKDPGASGDTLDQTMVNAINAAVGSHMKRGASKQEELIQARISAALEPHAQQLSQLQELLKKATEPKPAASKSGPSAEDLEWQKKFEAQQAAMSDFEKQLKREREARSQERRDALAERAYGTARGHLAELGIRPEGMDHVLKVLKVDNAIRVGDDGRISFALGDDSYDLKEGLAMWAKSPAAAFFMPPPTVKQTSKTAAGPVIKRPAGASPQEKPPTESASQKAERVALAILAQRRESA